MKRLLSIFLLLTTLAAVAGARTLIVYYSFTGNCRAIVTSLQQQISADVAEVQPADESVDYAANNYAIGDALIDQINNAPDDASSYPEIKPMEIDFSKYNTVIVVAPLWWSHIGAPMQSFLFANSRNLAGKHIGLVISSHSSGIATCEADAQRLLPDSEFFDQNLWINNRNLANRDNLIADWLKNIKYSAVTAINAVQEPQQPERFYDLMGRPLPTAPASGFYILNGQKHIR